MFFITGYLSIPSKYGYGNILFEKYIFMHLFIICKQTMYFFQMVLGLLTP